MDDQQRRTNLDNLGWNYCINKNKNKPMMYFLAKYEGLLLDLAVKFLENCGHVKKILVESFLP